jgi:hypothetical protein
MNLPYKGFSIIGGWVGVEGDEFLDEGADEVVDEGADEVVDEDSGLGVTADGLSSTGDSFDFGL